MRISFIGGGNMASALIAGLLENGWQAQAIRVVEIDSGARERLGRELNVRAHADLASGVEGAECIVLAVKPQHMREVARELAPRLGDALVVTIAAGIRHEDLARWLGGHARLVRAMPNTPALKRAGVTGLYAPPGVQERDRDLAQSILAVAGITLWVSHEAQMDAVTAVSGSGPAYVFYFIEALEKAAAGLGFEAAVARTLALETFRGAVTLAHQSEEPVSTLRERVTSKGGTTERALAELDARAVGAAIVSAVHSAAERSRELGLTLGSEPTEPRRS